MVYAKNLDELNSLIMQQMNKAVATANEKILKRMQKETKSFYSQGKPKLYIRTGALGESPRTTAITTSLNTYGGSISFDAYLEPPKYVVPNPVFINYGYPSSHNGLEVLESAENHTDGILGKPGFWKRSEESFQSLLDSAMKKYFKE